MDYPARRQYVVSSVLGVAVAVLMYGLTSSAPAGAQNVSDDSTGVSGSRGLDAAESRRARDRGRRHLRGAQSADQQSRAFVPSPQRYETLLVERRPVEKSDPRRLADVYVYDYVTDELLHSVIDPATDEVVFSSTHKNQQLPLTDGEAQRATQILFSDRRSRRSLERAFAQVTGRALTDLQHVDYKAIVFIADGSERGPAKQCGAIRCAEVLMYTADSQIVLDLRPVINMSAGRVLTIGRSRVGG